MFVDLEYESKFKDNFDVMCDVTIIFNNYFVQVKIPNIKIMHEIVITGNLFICTKIMIINHTLSHGVNGVIEG